MEVYSVRKRVVGCSILGGGGGRIINLTLLTIRIEARGKGRGEGDQQPFLFPFLSAVAMTLRIRKRERGEGGKEPSPAQLLCMPESTPMPPTDRPNSLFSQLLFRRGVHVTIIWMRTSFSRRPTHKKNPHHTRTQKCILMGFFRRVTI